MAVFGVLVLSFVLIYPIAQRHIHGQGSDREDALRVELVALTHHQYPYDARTFLNHRPTPLPGAMMLALPFFLIGRIAIQNLVWSGVFIAFLGRYFCKRATGAVFAAIFLIAALENLNDFDVGGDYVTNIMYVAVAAYLLIAALSRRQARRWEVGLTILLLGAALSSRAVYVMILPPLFVLIAQRSGLLTAVKTIASVIAVSILITLPVFGSHPAAKLLQQLSQNKDKFQYLPHFIPSSSLPIAALLLACASFWMRMNLARVYLIGGLSTLIMVAPPMISIIAAEGGLRRPLTADMEYLAVSAILISLWAMHRFESLALRHASPAAGE